MSDDEILEFFMEAARIQALIHTGDPKYESAPEGAGSLPSGESDPLVTLDCAGADTDAEEWRLERK